MYVFALSVISSVVSVFSCRPCTQVASSSSSASSGASTNLSTASSSLPSSAAHIQQLVVTKENYTLAMQALSSLLASQTDAEAPVSSETAIMLLPLIEDYVNAYLTLIHSAIDIYSSSSQSGSLSSHGSLESTVETMTSSLQGLMIEGAAFANQLEDCALNALVTLHTLVSYSDQVCQALVCDNYHQSAIDTEDAKHQLVGHRNKSPNGNKAQVRICLTMHRLSEYDILLLISVIQHFLGHQHIKFTVTHSLSYYLLS